VAARAIGTLLAAATGILNDALIRDLQRLETLRGTALLDSPPEEPFDRLTRLAARLTGAPVTFLSLVDEERDFYKSCFGFPEPLASERQLTGTTFCHYTIVSDGPLIIENAPAHPLYRDVPTVKSLGVQAYLGVPLRTATGQVLGSLCAVDFKPRAWSKLDIEVMTELAASTLREIELRAAMSALGAEQRLLATLIEHLPAGIVFVEQPTGRRILSNRRLEEILGHFPQPIDNLDPHTQAVGFHADGSPVQPQEWPTARALRGEVVRGEELLYQRGDGRRIWVRIHAAPVRDDHGEIIGGIAVLYDVDEQHRLAMENEQLYDAARSASQAKDQFFASVSHELRNPMTSIIGWAHVLEMDGLDRETMLEATQMIASSAALQAQLVDDLLDVSRIGAGKIALHPVPLDVDAVIAGAVRAARPATEAKRVVLREKLGQAGIVEADPDRLRQVIGNLLSNAVKFTPAGGTVEIESLHEDGTAVIIVRDPGRGIAPDLLPHIWDRGLQASNAEQGGLGLGLTIVRSLVEMHGGEVTAASDGIGKGATFTVRLPLIQVARQTPHDA
jgi:hypothetical protein